VQNSAQEPVQLTDQDDTLSSAWLVAIWQSIRDGRGGYSHLVIGGRLVRTWSGFLNCLQVDGRDFDCKGRELLFQTVKLSSARDGDDPGLSGKQPHQGNLRTGVAPFAAATSRSKSTSAMLALIASGEKRARRNGSRSYRT